MSQPDTVDVEDEVANVEQEPLPPRYFKRGDPIPHVPLEQLLEFENRYTAGARKDSAIGTELGLRPIHYYQQLNGAIDNPEAIAADPILCRRLQDDRTRRVTARQARRATRR